MYYSVHRTRRRSSSNLKTVLIIAPLVIVVATGGAMYGFLGKRPVRETSVTATTSEYYVSPGGSDSNNGREQISPFYSIQKAVDKASPGDTIHLMPGTYFQDVVSAKSGTDQSPITISGPSDAIVKGGGKSRIIEINHDFITLSGFTVDGLHGSASSKEGYREKLIYAIGMHANDGVTGLRILNMTLQHAKGECVRLRYFAVRNEVAYNTIRDCGVEDFVFNGGSKNGEGIYIGTAPEQLADGKNPTKETDKSADNWIHHNTISTQGNECIDIKEGSSANIVENNSCSGQKDASSGGYGIRGNNNIFRFNTVMQSVGAGFRIGGDTEDQGIHNVVYNNQILNNQSGGIKVMRSPQDKICGNTMSGNVGKDMVGTFRRDYNPSAPC